MKAVFCSTVILALLSLPLQAEEHRGPKPHPHQKQFAHEKREAMREHRQQESKEQESASGTSARPERNKLSDSETFRHQKMKAAHKKMEKMTPEERKAFKVKMHKKWSSLSDEKKESIKERVKHRQEERSNRREERQSNQEIKP